METIHVKEYSAPDCPARRGCVERKTSKSPYWYLRLDRSREYLENDKSEDARAVPVAGLVAEMRNRYGLHTTPTTRRTSYDIERRKYY